VQRIMRHSDPRLTTETYGHLELEDLRQALDNLAETTAPTLEAESFGTQLVPADENGEMRREHPTANRAMHLGKDSGPSRIRTWDQSVMSPGRGSWQGVVPGSTGSHLPENVRREARSSGSELGNVSIFSNLRGAPVVRKMAALLTVREVAETLAVSAATVYAMVSRGELVRIWIGGSIRIPLQSVEDFYATRPSD